MNLIGTKSDPLVSKVRPPRTVNTVSMSPQLNMYYQLYIALIACTWLLIAVYTSVHV